MLQALKAYYEDVHECVKTPEGLTECFSSSLGVKQGCPLSPTLFGMFIDTLEDRMDTAIPASTVCIGPRRVRLLLYADDIVFLATSESELQQMIDVFSDFCGEYELTVNMGKTAAVVFGNQRADIVAKVAYRGHAITQEKEYGINIWALFLIAS